MFIGPSSSVVRHLRYHLRYTSRITRVCQPSLPGVTSSPWNVALFISPCQPWPSRSSGTPRRRASRDRAFSLSSRIRSSAPAGTKLSSCTKKTSSLIQRTRRVSRSGPDNRTRRSSSPPFGGSSNSVMSNAWRAYRTEPQESEPQARSLRPPCDPASGSSRLGRKQAHNPLLPRSPTFAHLVVPGTPEQWLSVVPGTPEQWLSVVLGYPSAM